MELEEFETEHEVPLESEEERKERKKRERLARMQSMIERGKSVLKNVREVAGVAAKTFYIALKDDKFVSTFLDASGLLKKPNYQKEIAKNTSEMVARLQENSNRLEELKKRLEGMSL